MREQVIAELVTVALIQHFVEENLTAGADKARPVTLSLDPVQQRQLVVQMFTWTTGLSKVRSKVTKVEALSLWAKANGAAGILASVQAN